MNKVSKLATQVAAKVAKVAAATAAGIAGISAVVVLTASGGTAAADGGCLDDMHWVVCPTLDEVTDTVDDITDGIADDITHDMHW
ncbi:hypothetical protein [Actinophytocola glycyrrhizae]|uniref:Uncharacterized protein n=1 Tax=Actinophytocola glycyrrhizae TaxID=2044873 RepID=A0ABV9RW61_9PSEU